MKLSFEYKSQTIEFTVEYRKRKTLGIKIESGAVVRVAAPIWANKEDIIRVVKEKGQWITNKLEEVRKIDSKKIEKRYIGGEHFLCLGKEFPLQIIFDKSTRKLEARLWGDSLQVLTNTEGEEDIKIAIEEWYREITLDTAIKRIEYFSSCFKLKPDSVNISNAKKKWGSCNYKKVLMFNWRCGMLPLPIFDYIVLHEMCHMVHLNHSKDFWSLVESIMPDYKERKQWLKDNGVVMNL